MYEEDKYVSLTGFAFIFGLYWETVIGMAQRMHIPTWQKAIWFTLG